MIQKIKRIFSLNGTVRFASNHLIQGFSNGKPTNSLPWIAKLKNRSLLILHGPETYKYDKNEI